MRIKIPTIAVIVQLVAMALSSCQNGKYNASHSSDSEYRFDSLMRNLVIKYPELPDIKKQSKDFSYDKAFKVIKRTYFAENGLCYGTPELNYELRSFSPCGGCWNYQVAYIYNDSVNYILPLLDNYYFHLTASDKPKSFEDIVPKLCFEKELNRLFETIPVNLEYRKCIIDNLMSSCLNCTKTTRYDLPKIGAFAEAIQLDSFYNQDCQESVLKNLERIKIDIENPNKLVYHSFVFVYVFNFDKSNFEVEVLNYPCYSMFLW
ncbi:MAG: hypothetical protein IPP69_13980 [Flavobacteriales bacterium]|nr:hypothetical protein [Flavobacteriales bacterium]